MSGGAKKWTPAEQMMRRWQTALEHQAPPLNERPAWLSLADADPADYPAAPLATLDDGRRVLAQIRSVPSLIRGRVVAAERDRELGRYIVNVGLALGGLASLPLLWRAAGCRIEYLPEPPGMLARVLVRPGVRLGGGTVADAITDGLLLKVARSEFLHIHLFDWWPLADERLDILKPGRAVEVKAAIAALVVADPATGGFDVMMEETAECWCAYPLEIGPAA